MEQTKIDRIKAAVRANFEQSPDMYKKFEDEHAFFWKLNERLLRLMAPPHGAYILDVGCGTGASCVQILDAVPGSRVLGLDISPAMLEQARTAIGESERLTLVEGDASRLADYCDDKFDAIVYSASIFLIPDFRESLVQARSLLKVNGVVGLTFMDGLFDRDGNNVIAEADRSAGEGVSVRKPVRIDEFQTFFSEIFPDCRQETAEIRLSLDILKKFFSIPAMSAGLFPAVEYHERVRKIARIFDHIRDHEPIFRWLLMVGRK
ncbi:MAG: class I SAM-dependent methyltransferase [Desulfomonilaceae bacterium]|nr:class I SAM-dependent methyltransferase [Desulfomonilaceae bacterium]